MPTFSFGQLSISRLKNMNILLFKASTFIFSNEELNIEKKLRVEDFRLLRRRFNRSLADSVDTSVETNGTRTGRGNLALFIMIYIIHFSVSLNKEEFIQAFESILDPIEYEQLLEKLFDKVCFKKLLI